MRVVKFVRAALAIYALSWLGACVLINGIDADFWNRCMQYFVLAWTFDGLERLGFTGLFSLGFLAVGFGGFLVSTRSKKVAGSECRPLERNAGGTLRKRKDIRAI